MVISRTPVRVSLFGGGSDFPAWYRGRRGLVVSATIDKYCYLNVRYLPPCFDYKYRVRYSCQEYVGSIDDIRHSSVRECLRYLCTTDGLEIQHSSDLPARSGLGSSSAFTVGLLHALHGLAGRVSSKRQLANEAIDVEQNWIRDCVGSQDQIAVAFGGINTIAFGPGDRYEVAPLALGCTARNALEAHLLLCFTGVQRHGPDMAADQQRRASEHAAEMDDIIGIARQAIDVLGRPGVAMREIGRLLDLQWRIKRRLSALIATPVITDIYEAGMRAGAYGAKLLGAGGGGFMLFVAPPEGQAAIRAALNPLRFVPFRFETAGSQLLYQSPSAPDA